jgi:hypothetical protein
MLLSVFLQHDRDDELTGQVLTTRIVKALTAVGKRK